MFASGQRDQLITFERARIVIDSHGGEIETWFVLCNAWAAVRYGSGEERRVAAQEQVSQPATFTVLAGAARGVTERDRIRFNGLWDIRSVVPSVDRADLMFTAVRA